MYVRQSKPSERHISKSDRQKTNLERGIVGTWLKALDEKVNMTPFPGNRGGIEDCIGNRTAG